MSNNLEVMVTSICNEIDVMNFIIGSTQIHYGGLVLNKDMEQTLVEHMISIEQILLKVKEHDKYTDDKVFHDYIDDIELFLKRIKTAISASRTQRFIYNQIYA